MLCHAWRVSGADPYRLYNGLDEQYRPLHNPELAARPPQFPERVRMFVYACALAVKKMDDQRQAQLVKGIAAAVARAMGGR